MESNYGAEIPAIGGLAGDSDQNGGTMNLHEGAQRIKSIGKYAMCAAGLLFALLACLLTVALLWPSLGISMALMEAVLLPSLLAVPGATLWLLGWVIEGFGEKTSHGARVQNS
jgi:hypothetical protein